MRPNAHIIKRCFSGVQVTITIPRHFAQALGMFGPGYVAFRINDRNELVIDPYPKEQNSHGNAAHTLDLNRPAEQSA